MATAATDAERSYTLPPLIFIFHSIHAIAGHLLPKFRDLEKTLVGHYSPPSHHALQLTHHQEVLPLGPERDAIVAELRRLGVQIAPLYAEAKRLKAEIVRRRRAGEWGAYGEEYDVYYLELLP